METKQLLESYKALLARYKNWFNKLKPNQQRLVIWAAALFSILLFFKIFLNPAFTQISQLRKQEEKNRSRIASLSEQFPDIDKTRSEIKEVEADIANNKRQAFNIESQLFGSPRIPQLLTQLVKCADNLSIDFQSVKQKIETSKEDFNRLYIDLEFDSSYEDAVNYIRKVEEISPFIRVEEAQIVQSKTDPRNLINSSLRLSALLAADSPEAEPFLSEGEDTGKKLSISRSPLMPKFSLGTSKKKPLKLTGITFRKEQQASTAIINNTVVRVGDEVEGVEVKEINFDSVVINDGAEDKVLNIER